MAPPQGEIEEFIAQLALSRGLSVNTRTSYRNDIKAFARFMKSAGKPLLGAERGDIAAFMAKCHEEGLADTTVSRRFMALRTFFAWLSDEGVAKTNPTAAMPRPAIAKKLPRTLTEEQTKALLDSCVGDDPASLRDRAMLELLYASGLRASELVGLTLDDINLADGFLRCQGKGSKQRFVPVGSAATNALVAYIERGREEFARESTPPKALFLSSRGNVISRIALWKVVVEAAKRAGLWGKVHPHTLRHCFATHLLAHGADIRAIQEMLGHADIATTQIYTHVDADRVLSVHRQFHPRR